MKAPLFAYQSNILIRGKIFSANAPAAVRNPSDPPSSDFGGAGE